MGVQQRDTHVGNGDHGQRGRDVGGGGEPGKGRQATNEPLRAVSFQRLAGRRTESAEDAPSRAELPPSAEHMNGNVKRTEQSSERRREMRRKRSGRRSRRGEVRIVRNAGKLSAEVAASGQRGVLERVVVDDMAMGGGVDKGGGGGGGGGPGDAAAGVDGEPANLSALSRLEDRDTKPIITGVMTLHIKEARKLHLGDAYKGQDKTVYVRISIRTLTKRTRVVTDNYGAPQWEQTKHFPVTVLRNRKHPFNWLMLEVFRFEPGSQDEHDLLGSVSFHLHDILQATPVEGSFDLFNNDTYAGELHLAVLFNYGFFGYGYSVQYPIGNPPEAQLDHSLFPRIQPPDDRLEPRRLTLIPRAVPHPSYIPFNEEVHIGYGKEVGLHPEKADTSAASVPNVSKRVQGRLLKLREDLNSVQGRASRLAFLHAQLVNADAPEEVVIHEPGAVGPDGRDVLLGRGHGASLGNRLRAGDAATGGAIGAGGVGGDAQDIDIDAEMEAGFHRRHFPDDPADNPHSRKAYMKYLKPAALVSSHVQETSEENRRELEQEEQRRRLHRRRKRAKRGSWFGGGDDDNADGAGSPDGPTNQPSSLRAEAGQFTENAALEEEEQLLVRRTLSISSGSRSSASGMSSIGEDDDEYVGRFY